MLPRPAHLKAVETALKTHPVVGLIGARQVGKTTLARQVEARHPRKTVFFDLEDPRHLARLADPMLALEGLRGLVIIDEIQRKPELFPVLRVLADRPRRPARFLLLGSASPELLRQGSESLAGRISYHVLPGLSLAETPDEKRLWLRGGFPRSFLAQSAKASAAWLREFIAAFLERDLPQLGTRIPAPTLRRFWNMLAHYHGQVWNASEFGRSFGVADTTVRGYLDLLSAAFVVRQLQPWTENIKKRQVRSPKVYLEDSGILHHFLGISSFQDLENHPKVGASWEGFALSQIVRSTGARAEEIFFWATHAGAELDLLWIRGKTRLGFEFKRTSSPRVTPSMRTAIKDLGLKRLFVVFPGEDSYELGRKIRAVGLASVSDGFPGPEANLKSGRLRLRAVRPRRGKGGWRPRHP